MCNGVTIKSITDFYRLQCLTPGPENFISATLDDFRPQGIGLDFKMNEETSTKIQRVSGIINISRLTTAN